MRRFFLLLSLVGLLPVAGCTPAIVVRVFNRAIHPIRVSSEEQCVVEPGDSILVHAWSAKKGEDYGVLITEEGIEHFYPLRRSLIESMPRQSSSHHWYAAAGGIEVSVEYAEDAKLYAIDARHDLHARIREQPLGFPIEEKK